MLIWIALTAEEEESLRILQMISVCAWPLSSFERDLISCRLLVATNMIPMMRMSTRMKNQIRIWYLIELLIYCDRSGSSKHNKSKSKIETLNEEKRSDNERIKPKSAPVFAVSFCKWWNFRDGHYYPWFLSLGGISLCFPFRFFVTWSSFIFLYCYHFHSISRSLECRFPWWC